MNNITTHTGKLQIIERLRSSGSGNPRYLLTVGGTVCRTTPDSHLAWGLPNYDGREVTAKIGMHYGQPSLDSISPIVDKRKRKS